MDISLIHYLEASFWLKATILHILWLQYKEYRHIRNYQKFLAIERRYALKAKTYLLLLGNR